MAKLLFLSMGILCLGACSDTISKQELKQLQPLIVDCVMTTSSGSDGKSREVISDATTRRMASVALSVAKQSWTEIKFASGKAYNLSVTLSGSRYGCEFVSSLKESWEIAAVYKDDIQIFSR
ncbi:MAG: hypothetical protein P8Q37_01755 [Porticoccaceae bacterium]|nr:hypothetical protein [Porticoccaceae bacterium]MDG1473597.1 hypothetical protein [Porticoccaceae bacterium]